jgi:AcrR family transcriptional regulator
MKIKASKPVSEYHHGNLRETLIEGALATLQAHGAADFSLSELARKIGVTPAAAYRHFTDKSALIDELAKLGFDHLAQEFARVIPLDADVRDARTARARFTALGRAYVEFGLSNPALFGLMFGAAGAQYRRQFSQTISDRPSTYTYLKRGLADLADHGLIVRPKEEDEWFAWSAIHGATQLALAEIPGPPTPLLIAKAIVARIIQAFRRA